MSQRHSRKRRGEWEGNQCFDDKIHRHLLQMPFSSDEDPTTFFFVGPNQKASVFRALDRLVNSRRASKSQSEQNPKVSIFTAA